MRWCGLWLALTALVVAGCGRAPRAALGIDPLLAELVPGDTVTLVGVRLEALRATPLWQKWVTGKPVAPLDELAKETGLDLRKDVSEVLLASNGKEGLVLTRGRFSRAELEASLERGGGKRMPYKGATLIGSEETAVVFLGAEVVAAGPTGLLGSVLDQRGRYGIPKALLEEAKGIAAESQLWAVSLGGFDQVAHALPQAGNLSNLTKILELMEKSTFAADVRSGLNATATAVCRSDQDAKTLSEALRGIIGLARLSTPDSEPDLLRAWDGTEVSAQQRTVRLRAQIAPELLDKLLGKVSAAGPGAFTPGFQLPRRP